MNIRDHVQPVQSPLVLYGTSVSSRMMVGTAGYPSPAVLSAAVAAAGADIVTVSLRREMSGESRGAKFFELIQALGVRVLPNTAGCRSAREAITTAHMAREVFATDWIKLEVIANDDTLQPDVFGLVEAAENLNRDGFKVFPYTTEDLSVAERLQRAGCDVIMPWAAPIGTAQGLINRRALESLRAYFPSAVLVVDAGLGAPSHAAQAMEIGFDAVLLNSAIANARDPVAMAAAFSDAVRAGRRGYEAGLLPPRDMAVPSTPVAGTPFFDLGGSRS